MLHSYQSMLIVRSYCNCNKRFVCSNSNIRLDGALRDAKESSQRCVLCDFSNSKHRIFCLLCGATLKEPTSENKNTIKILESSEWNNQRQRRARYVL